MANIQIRILLIFSAYILRKRIREERKKETQEKIKQMKDRQQKSEVWKKRRTYLKPICIGLALIVGGLLLYRYYTYDPPASSILGDAGIF